MKMENKHLFCWLFSGALVFVACGGNDKESAAAATQANAVKDYPVITVTPRTTTLHSDFPATIQGQQDIEIRPRIDGYLEKIYVDEGETVKINQKLFQINSDPFDQQVRTAQANIKIAQADVHSAQMEVNKVRPLVEKGIISKYELQSAQFNLEARQGALAQARASLANARINLGYTTIASPANGVVGTIPYKIGSLVSSNTTSPLTTVSNTARIYAYFSISEKNALEFSRNTKGATTEERLATLPPVSLILANGTVYEEKGSVEATSGSINTQTGSIRVRATFPNPRSVVRSGSSGLVRIPRTIEDALLVPQRSTYEIQGKRFVYVLDTGSTVSSREIRTLPNSGGQFYVVEDGLETGEKIVLEGVASLREGVRINPQEISADSAFVSK